MAAVAPRTNERRRRGDRGAVLLVIALTLPVLIIMTAFAVDLGRQRASRRTMQARADVIALDLVRIINGRTEAQINADPATAQAIAASAARNDIEVAKLDPPPDFGYWDGDSFSTTPPGTQLPNAVLVTAQEDTEYFFQPGDGHAIRTAVATASGEAEFSIGSYAAGVATGESDILAALLGDALGINGTLVGYSGLADSEVDLQLLAEELVLAGVIGSPDELLTSEVEMSDLMLAAAQALRNNPDSNPDDLANAELLEQYALQVPGGVVVPLGDVFHVEQGGEAAALTSDMNVLDLIAAGAFVANGDNFIGVPEFAVNLPGFGNITQVCTTLDPPAPAPCSALRVIEAPVTHRGGVGTGTSTRQIALRVGGGLPNIAGLAGVTVQLGLDNAVGRATITDIRCGDPTAFDLFVQTGLFESELELKGRLANLLDVTIRVTRLGGDTDFEDGDGDSVTFLVPDDVGGPGFEAGEGDIGLSGTQIQVIPGGPVGTLLKPVFDLAVNNLLSALLSPTGLLKTIDDSLLTPLAQALGLNVAGADVHPLDADCTRARLVR